MKTLLALLASATLSAAAGEKGALVCDSIPSAQFSFGAPLAARVGANISETGLAWAAFEWGGKQALPYLWPRVVLGR